MIMTIELKDGSKVVSHITGYVTRGDSIDIITFHDTIETYKTTFSTKGSKLTIRTDDMQKLLENLRIFEA